MNIKLIFPTQKEDQKAFQNCIDTLHCHMIFTTLNELDLTYEEISQVLKDTKSIISTKNYDPEWMNHYSYKKVV